MLVSLPILIALRHIIYSYKQIDEHFPIQVQSCKSVQCHIQVHLSRNNISAVKPPPNHTSLPSTVATFLTTHLMAVLQPSGYSVFHSGDTSIQLGLL